MLHPHQNIFNLWLLLFKLFQRYDYWFVNNCTEDLERPAVIEDGPPAASGREETETEPCSKSTHLEEEQQKELNIYTRDSAPTAPQCKGSTSQEPQGLQETCAAVKTTNRSGA